MKRAHAPSTCKVSLPGARVAARFISLLDTDGDNKLSQKELYTPSLQLCYVYAAILARGTTLASVVRALTLPLPHGFIPSAFLEALKSSAADRAGMEPSRLALARYSAEATQLQLDPASTSAILEAYIRLAPTNAILTVPPNTRAQDEL